MPDLSVVNFNIVCATLGGFITLFGLVSFLLKEKFYLSETLFSTFAGLVLSPHGTDFIKPLQYANDSQENLETITLYFSRLVLGVQLVLAGVQLPSKYLWTERKSLSLLLGPGMCAMWLCSSLLVWALVPNIDFLFALAIGACVTPTDPVLSNNIVKGKFADKNIPPSLQKIIIAESGANDGLGYPFLFLALYLVKYTGQGGLGSSGGAREAMGLWFGETWGYTILMSVAYGAAVGWLAKELLHWAEDRHYVDRESFLVFAITLALFIVGTVGMLGSDDVLACFIAGNTFTWDDWFRLETMDDSLQPTIDMLLNVSVFMWFGAVCPWHKFVDNDVIPIYRLIPLGILILLFRRLPMVFLYHKLNLIHQIEDSRHAWFVGYFGPIGVSAIFYLYISRHYLLTVTPIVGNIAGTPLGERTDAQHLGECIEVVVWFLVICSIVVHGLSIPLGKLGFYLPRTISTAISFDQRSTNRDLGRADRGEDDSPTRVFNSRGLGAEHVLRREFQRRRATTSELGPAVSPINWISTAFTRLGRKVNGPSKTPPNGQNLGSDQSDNMDSDAVRKPSIIISGPTNPRKIGNTVHETNTGTVIALGDLRDDRSDRTSPSSPSRVIFGDEHAQFPSRPQTGTSTPPGPRFNRSILFADESDRAQSRNSASSVEASQKTRDESPLKDTDKDEL